MICVYTHTPVFSKLEVRTTSLHYHLALNLHPSHTNKPTDHAFESYISPWYDRRCLNNLVSYVIYSLAPKNVLMFLWEDVKVMTSARRGWIFEWDIIGELTYLTASTLRAWMWWIDEDRHYAQVRPILLCWFVDFLRIFYFFCRIVSPLLISGERKFTATMSNLCLPKTCDS